MNAREWSSRIAELAHREQAALADLLLAVAEFDGQEAYRQLGFSSLFDFLHREVGLSRGSAYYRQVGARMVRRFPEIEGPVRDGRLCITTVSELAKVITEENRTEVLPMFFGLSRQEAKQLVARLRPVEQVPMRTVVTEVPPMAPMESAPAIVQPVGRAATHPGRDALVPVQPRTVVEPMTSRETRLHVTVSPEFVALLRKAKAGQSHVQPGANEAEGFGAREGEAGGASPGRGQVPVAAGLGWSLRLGCSAGDRPCGTAGEGRPVHAGQLQAPLQTPQRRGRAPSLR
jgi:hypothetical protein